jgi:hypothetical protein
MGIVLGSAIVGHQAWHWMLERGAVLWRTPWPHPTRQGMVSLAQWAVAIAVVVALGRLVPKRIARRKRGSAASAA